MAVLSGAACGSGVVRPHAAEVNGTSITAAELDQELDAIVANEQYMGLISQEGFQVKGKGKGTLDMSFVSQTLTRQVLYSLVHQELVKRKVPVTRSDLDAVRPDVVESVGGGAVFAAFPPDYQAVLVRRRAEIDKLQQALSGVAVDEAAMRKFYDESKELFAETCVAHILFAVVSPTGQIDQAATAAQADALRTQANQVKAQLDAGGDFAALAKQHSVDAGSKENGGDLECGPPGRFVPEFETAMDTTPTGAVSAPAQSDFGFHLIKVTDRRTQPFEQVQAQIRQRLLQDAQGDLSEFLRTSVLASKISVNPRYGRFQTDGPAPGILPPTAPTTLPPGRG